MQVITIERENLQHIINTMEKYLKETAYKREDELFTKSELSPDEQTELDTIQGALEMFEVLGHHLNEV